MHISSPDSRNLVSQHLGHGRLYLSEGWKGGFSSPWFYSFCFQDPFHCYNTPTSILPRPRVSFDSQEKLQQLPAKPSCDSFSGRGHGNYGGDQHCLQILQATSLLLDSQPSAGAQCCDAGASTALDLGQEQTWRPLATCLALPFFLTQKKSRQILLFKQILFKRVKIV